MKRIIALSLFWLLVSSDTVAYADIFSKIKVIHATSGKEFIDPPLQPISAVLKKAFGARFSSFKLLEEQTLTLKLNEKVMMTLPNGNTISLTHTGMDGPYFKIIVESPGLRTQVNIHEGGTFYQAGKSYNGGMLILSITISSQKM